MKDRLLYPIDEACEMLGGLSRSTIYAMIRSGQINAVKVGARSFITADELDEFICSLDGAIHFIRRDRDIHSASVWTCR